MRKLRLACGAGLGAFGAAVALLAGACGSRTGLPVDDVVVLPDGAIAFPDVRPPPRDATRDREPDALPLIDANPLPDVVRNDCPDASTTWIYVISQENGLFAFEPPTATIRRIGTIACPAPPGAAPFSMAVDRKGVAYIVFQDVDTSTGAALPGNGTLWRVSTLTAACIATPFQPNQRNISTFGMGFASNANGPAETLFIASDNFNGTSVARLGTIDVTTFQLGVVGAFSPPINNAELTGTGDGRLFAFYSKTTGGSAIGQIDKQTGQVLAESPLPTVDQGQHWAFGFWGGDFFTFTGPNGAGSDVTRFRPADGSVVNVAHFGEDIVGAGVSTCAPER